MRKYYLFFLAFTMFFGQWALGQKSKITSAWSYMQTKDFEKARDAINIAVANESTKDNPEAWLYRGQVYQNIYSDPNLKAKEPNALIESAQSYRKALVLDVKHRNESDIKDGLVMVTLFLFNEGEISFGNKKFEVSQNYLLQYDSSYNVLGNYQKKVDRAFASTNPPTDKREVILLLAGCAMQLHEKEMAQKYFEQLVESKYQNSAVFIQLAKYYVDEKDTAKAYSTLDQGINSLPDTMKGPVLIEKLKLLVAQGKGNEAMKVGEDAITHQPNNLSLYVAMSKMYSDSKDYDKAIALLKKAQEVSPNNFSVESRLGIIKFNQGVDKFNISVDSKSSADQDKYLNEAKAIWKDAIKDLEGSLNLPHDNDPEDLRATYGALSQMYYQLQDPANGKKYRDLAKQMK